MPFPLFLALVYLRPRRSFASAIPVITVTGVMLGVAILMIVLGVMTGFGDVWREKILSFKPHVTVYERRGEVRDPDAVCEAALSVPGVQSACPALVFPAMIRTTDGGDPVTVQVVGIDPERPSILANASDHLVAGAFDVTEDRALVGVNLARRLRSGPGGRFLCYSPLNLKSADELYFPEELELAGVYDMRMRDFDDGLVICSLGMARDLLGMDHGAGLVQVQTDNPERALETARTLQMRLDELAGSGRYAVSTWQEEDRVLFDALRTEKAMMFLLLAFIAVVAAFCVANTLIVITIQKTREIGLLKALGFPARSIRTAFVLNGMLQCVVGEALGVGLACLVLHNLQRMVDLLASFGLYVFPKEVYGLTEIPWRIVNSDVAAVVGTVFGICLVASFLPAWLASRLDPVKAIGQE